MSLPVIPVYISPIIGHRVWGWDAKEGVKSLHGDAWLPGRAIAAECILNYNHECPADDCSCGVYAAKIYEHLAKIGHQRMGPFLHGEVCLWGRVVEHEFGYRAQFAYPQTFVLPSNIDLGSRLSCLESLIVYGVDVLTSTNTLLWKRG